MYEEDFNPPAVVRVADLDIDDKPREKAMKNGIQSLSKAELMAIILGSGIVGKSVIALSQDILRDNDNSLHRLSQMSVDELCSRYKGIGPAKAISLKAAVELGTRSVEDGQVLPEQITGGHDVYNLMRQKLQNINYEEFWVLHLSRSNRVMARECVSRGGTVGTVVDTKLILKSAVNKLASSLILVHNHPSGTLSPSGEDDYITRRIKEAARLLDIRVIDHVIIASTGYYSYNDHHRL